MNTPIINDNTIDQLLFEWLDGKLDPATARLLEEAISNNPRWQETLHSLRLARIHQSALPAFDATSLYRRRKDKTPGAENFDEFAIAYTEGLLSDGEEKMFFRYLHQHPDKEKDLEQYRKARIIADSGIVFSGRHKLKKTAGRVVPLKVIYASVAVAASLLALFTLLRPYNPLLQPRHPQPVAVVPAPSPSDTLQLKTTTTRLSRKSDTTYRRQIAVILVKEDTTINDSLPAADFYRPQPLLQATVDNPSGNLLANHTLSASAFPTGPESPEYGKFLLTQPARVLHTWRNRDKITIDGPTLLQAGIARIAYWTGTDMRLEYQKGDDGKVKKVEFYSPLVAYESTFYRNR